MKELFNKIKNDPIIIELYNNIHKYEDNEEGFAYHDYIHVLNVSESVKSILSILNFDEELIYSAQIAAVLHDTGALQGKDDHALRGYLFAKKYFIDNNIDFKNKEQVLEAIKIHSNGFDTDNIIALALILADKLDVKYTRIAPAGKEVIGNRQYCNIEDIEITIKGDIFIFNFKTNNNIDLKELNEYYFTKKIFKAISSFCNKIDKKYKIYLDNKDWNIN